jgi:uncharacterized damage-inducible protein DinB
MTQIIDSVRAEYVRYKALAEGAIEQITDADLNRAGPNEGLSIAMICWHVSGNLRSRFTDFLTTDGEKPWRQRDEEFESRAPSRAELMTKWEQGWSVLLATLSDLSDKDLERTVTIRQQKLLVHEALLRSVTHTSYHVGQIVSLAKSFRGGDWKSLSIPLGQSQAYNLNPHLETSPKK